MDISNITDVKELKALRGDCYQERENAVAVQQQANENIKLINKRIAEVENAEAKKDKTPPKK